MPLDVRPLTPSDLPALRTLCEHPSLALEVERLRRSGAFDDPPGDPYIDPRGRWVGFVDGGLAGYGVCFVLPSPRGTWALSLVGVAGPHRRRGLGSALLERAHRHFDGLHAADGLIETCLSAWRPNDEAVGFATRHGYQLAGTLHLMERPRGVTPEPPWPPGIEVRAFDGSDRAFADWCQVGNASFADSPRTVTSTVSELRAIARRQHFPDDGMRLAYRNGACVGFCRTALLEERPEVDVLGVVPEARGIGLGRALLRWGIGWLQEHDERPVTLMVDAQNDRALRLYHDEGFATRKARDLWARPMGSPRPGES
jgi:mycothiol synthase